MKKIRNTFVKYVVSNVLNGMQSQRPSKKSSFYNSTLSNFPCEFCEFAAKSREKLDDHTTRRHFSKNTIYCNICNFSTKMASDLKAHIRVNHSERATIHKCTECDYVSKWNSNVKRQYKRKHVKNPTNDYQCDICGKSYTTKKNVNIHQYSIHGIKSVPLHKCSECDFESVHRNVRDSHYDAQHTSDTAKCDLCEKVLKNKNNLRMHVNSS